MTSNTGENRKPGTFQKGDPRINRKGRPKNFDALRKLAQTIGNELTLKDGELVEKTTIERILRKWALSNEPVLQKAFVEIAYGKVPDNLNIKSDNKIHFIVDYADGLSDNPTETT